MRSILVPGFLQLRNGQRRKAFTLNLATAALLLGALTPWWRTPAGLVAWLAAFLLLLVLALWDARRHRGGTPLPMPPWMWAPVLLAAAVVIFAPFRVYRIPTSSCTPALHPGDRIMAEHTGAHVARGTMVLFRRPDGQTFVKRVIGLPGDRVEGGPGGVRVNGDAVSPENVDEFATTVAAGTAFVLGDNIKNSRDSRHFGPIELDAIIGRARYVLWGSSWDRILRTIR